MDSKKEIKKAPAPGFEPRIPEGQVCLYGSKASFLIKLFVKVYSRPAQYRVMRRWHDYILELFIHFIKIYVLFKKNKIK